MTRTWCLQQSPAGETLRHRFGCNGDYEEWRNQSLALIGKIVNDWLRIMEELVPSRLSLSIKWLCWAKQLRPLLLPFLLPMNFQKPRCLSCCKICILGSPQLMRPAFLRGIPCLLSNVICVSEQWWLRG